jgi:beta-glucosidase
LFVSIRELDSCLTHRTASHIADQTLLELQVGHLDEIALMLTQGESMNETIKSTDRRQFLTGAAGAAVVAAIGGVHPVLSASEPKAKSFPKNFRWGVATAGHQIEGNNTNSDLWLLENIKPTVYVERSGDACDSYHRYEEDIALLAGLGFNSYRFSIEWARVEPNRGFFSNAELDYYKRVLETCRRHGVAPAVTFIHGTAPRWFAEAGGWLNPDAPALFAHYCSAAAKELARDMEFAFTINEPQVAKSFRALPGSQAYWPKRDEAALAMLAAAAKATGSERFVTTDHPDIDAMAPQLIAGHVQGYAAIKAERSDLPVGVTLNISDFEPGTEDSPYEEVRKNAYGNWMETCKKTCDFVGAQVYRQFPIPGKGKPLPPLAPLPFTEGEGMMAPFTRPEALRNGVEYVYTQTQKPIVVSENGIDTENDKRRIWYIDAALAGLQEAIAKGVPVLGYFHWSLLDNFEWTQGYKPKYGLVAVDRTTFKRTPKPSAEHLGAIARRNGI